MLKDYSFKGGKKSSDVLESKIELKKKKKKTQVSRHISVNVLVILSKLIYQQLFTTSWILLEVKIIIFIIKYKERLFSS